MLPTPVSLLASSPSLASFPVSLLASSTSCGLFSRFTVGQLFLAQKEESGGEEASLYAHLGTQGGTLTPLYASFQTLITKRE